MKPNWIFFSMPLVIGPHDGLGLEGVPWLNVGLVGVTSSPPLEDDLPSNLDVHHPWIPQKESNQIY